MENYLNGKDHLATMEECKQRREYKLLPASDS